MNGKKMQKVQDKSIGKVEEKKSEKSRIEPDEI